MYVALWLYSFASKKQTEALFPHFLFLQQRPKKVIKWTKKKTFNCTYSWGFSDKYSSEAIGHATAERKKDENEVNEIVDIKCIVVYKLWYWSDMWRVLYLKSVFSIVNFTFSSVSSVIFTLGWFAYGILSWFYRFYYKSCFCSSKKSNMATRLTEQTYGMKRMGSGNQNCDWLILKEEMIWLVHLNWKPV